MLPKQVLICFLAGILQIPLVLSDKQPDSSGNSSIVCGNARKVLNDCFNNLPPELLKFLSISKIPVTKSEIVGKCDVFQQGMKCIDEYTKKCIEAEKRKLFDSTVFGAKSFLKKLCYDSHFQADYLRHKECFVFIEDDWQRCSSQFLTILTEELHSVDNRSKNISNKFMQFCCSRYAYEQCIGNSAKIKCHKTSANFVENVVQILSRERHFHNCKRYEDLLCSSAETNSINVFVLYSIVVISSIFTYIVGD
ncbi:unnamed protein product [Hermetia illucens]|uniref:DUF19 domain-containing protein n=1 Tax=Hermetia illucens TaxID=343691 RepID=A0A7R8UNQ0_HERIL|nr:uncharacterized protein LOC119651647 [Hermetia illucens]CAD7084213.1 unnamed protein product [Hermetia illucens]